MNKPIVMPRRKAILGMGAAVAVAASERDFASEPAPQNEALMLENPVTKFPKPPFEEQSQPWPGLACKMNPIPDHGEKSYKGSGRLTGSRALITGGDSGMGRAAAIAYAREGADVAINYYPTEEPDAKQVTELMVAAGRKAVPIPGDLREETFCKQLVEQAVKALGGLDMCATQEGNRQRPPFWTSPRRTLTRP